MSMIVSVLLTCFNRRELTLSCLDRLSRQQLPDGVTLKVFLLDDGSSDRTEEAVREAFPDVDVFRGDGNHYWCGGMRVVWKAAAMLDPDYYLLVNDDTQLSDDAVAVLLALAGAPAARRIAVGTIADSVTGLVNYGGVSPEGKVLTPEENGPCRTFNANCVLVTRAVYQERGILCEAYSHSMGDTDYGFQASKRGIEILKSDVFLGTCGSNSIKGTWRDTSLRRGVRFRLLNTPKGLPYREWFVFCFRNCGWKAPYLFIVPVARILLGK